MVASNPYEGLSEKALDVCVRRMAKTLTSKPKRKKTRDYVATIRGRESKNAEQIEKELRAIARKAETQRGIEIANRVIAKAKAGDVPAMPRTRKQRVSPIALNRRREQEKARKHYCRGAHRLIVGLSGDGGRDHYAAKSMRPALVRVQDYRCAICGHDLPEKAHEATVDHVIPLAMGGADAPGNWVAAHRDCNNAKANDKPTGCEMVFLLMVNCKLGLHPQAF